MNISAGNNIAFKSAKVTYTNPDNEQGEITYKDGEQVWIKKTQDGFRISVNAEDLLQSVKLETLQSYNNFIEVKDLLIKNIDKNTYVHYNAGSNSSEKLYNVDTSYFTEDAANRSLIIENVGQNGKLEVIGNNYDFDSKPNAVINNIEAKGFVKSKHSSSVLINNIAKNGSLNLADSSLAEILNNNGEIFVENNQPDDTIFLQVNNNNKNGNISIGKCCKKEHHGIYDIEIDSHKGLLNNFASNLCNIRKLFSEGRIFASGKDSTVDIESLDSGIRNGTEFKTNNIILRNGAKLTDSATKILDKRV